MSVSVSNGSSVWRDSMRSNLRRRHAAGDGNSGLDNSGEVESSIGIKTLRAVDIYARVDEDLQLKTEAGAAVTIGFWLLMLVLIVGEVRAFMKEQPAIERVVVDSTMGQRLRINADIVSAKCGQNPKSATISGNISSCLQVAVEIKGR